jgi:hypothetical protein
MGRIRRAMLRSLCAASLAIGAPAARAAPAQAALPAGTAERAIVQMAIRAAGGRSALEHAATLRWSGDAVVYTAGGRFDIHVETVVHPFRSAHSESWLHDEGPAQRRVLHIDPDGGWIEREGQRAPLPAAVLGHERQQYALYGLMRLLPLLEDGVTLRRLPERADGQLGLHVEHPAAPPADLYFDAAGHLSRIEDRVANPDGGAPLAQRIELGGSVPGAAIRWPRTVTILQNGSPYFELTIQRLSTGD